MPASSWSALQRYEQQFDAALGGRDDFALSPASPILSIFSDAPFSFALYPQQSAETLRAPRLEYQFALGRPAGPRSVPQMRAKRGATARVLAWNFSLLFRFVYDHRKLSDAQRGFDGALRELLSPPEPADTEAAAFNSITLPWLAVTALSEVSAIRGLVKDKEAEKEFEAWESRWEGVFSIRHSAIPD